MKDINQTIESLTKASQTLNLAREDLLEALRHSDAVQGIVILDTLPHVTNGINAVDRLLNALMREDE
jgi:hypothetical protein